jgi:hypothetical protein
MGAEVQFFISEILLKLRPGFATTEAVEPVLDGATRAHYNELRIE